MRQYYFLARSKIKMEEMNKNWIIFGTVNFVWKPKLWTMDMLINKQSL